MTNARIAIALVLMYLGTAAPLPLHAQGRINFNNSSSTPLRISDGFVTQILGTASTARFGIGPASVVVRLYAGSTSNMLSPVLVGTCACLPSVTNTASGIAAAQGTFNGGSNLVLPGFDGSAPVFLQFTATSINGFYLGQSPIIQVTPATGAAAATPVFSTTADASHWNGLTIIGLDSGPSIWAQPHSQSVPLGGNATLSVGVTGLGAFAYQWQHFGTNLQSATGATYDIVGATFADAGDYRVLVTNSYFGVTLVSSTATITVFDPQVEFALQPASQIVPLYGVATFSALASGNPAPNYQWLFNGAAIPGATATNLVLTNIDTSALGNYSVIASNTYSSVTSSAAALLMSPSLRNPFAGAVAVWGKAATLSVSAVGSGDLTYQWHQDGAPVLNATNATLVFSSVQITNGGWYHVVVSSALGSVTNAPAQLVINPASTGLGFCAGITIEGVVGYTYGIEYSTNLSATGTWTLLTNLTLTQPVQLWIDTSVESRGPGHNGRYYRVIAP